MGHMQRHFSPFLVCLCIASVTGISQEGKVTVVDAGSKELKRTAYRLQMPPEQLKNARSALREASDLIKQMDPMPAPDLGRLAKLWVELNRPKAVTALEGLVEKLRKQALAADDLEIYRECSGRAQTILAPLSDADPDKVLQLVREWPRPPLSAGSAGEKVRSNMEAQVRDQLIRRMAYKDPERAMALADESPTGTSVVYEVRGQRIGSLARQGRKDEALRLADQGIADFNLTAADPAAVRDYLSFLRQVAPLDPNRFLAGITSIAPWFSSSDTRALPMFLVGDPGVPVSQAEQALLLIFRARMQPELVLKTLDLLPELKAKAQQAGGIDKLMTGPRRPFRSGVPYAASPATAKTAGSEPEYPAFDKEALLVELRGKAEKNPGLVRERLAEVARDPHQVEDLMEFARMAQSTDPELGSMALDAARPLLSRVEPIQERARLYVQMAEAYRICDGDSDTGLLRDGFALVVRMREERNQTTGTDTGAGDAADELEAALAAELSRIDFDSAMRYVRAIDEKPLRLAALLRIAETLREWFSY